MNEKEFRSNAILILTLLGGLTFAGLVVVLSNYAYFHQPVSLWTISLSRHFYFVMLTVGMATVTSVCVLGSVSLLIWGDIPESRLYRVLGILAFDIAVVLFAFLLPLFLVRITIGGTILLFVIDIGLLFVIGYGVAIEKRFFAPKKTDEKKPINDSKNHDN